MNKIKHIKAIIWLVFIFLDLFLIGAYLLSNSLSK